jgi:ankyrin repeat protein
MDELFNNSRKIANNNSYAVKKTRSVSFAPEILLFNAVVENDVSELEGLIHKHNVNVNYRSPSGLTASHYAALEGGFECLKVLVESGASIDVLDAQGCSPLDFAVRGGHFDCAAYLIKAGAEITKIVNGMKN